MFDKIGKFFLKENVLNVLSVASVVAILLALYSLTKPSFSAIGLTSMFFLAMIFLLHTIYFYKKRNGTLVVINILGIIALIATSGIVAVISAINANACFALLYLTIFLVAINILFAENRQTNNLISQQLIFFFDWTV